MSEKGSLEAIAEGLDTGGQWLEDFIKNTSPTTSDFKKARIISSHRSTQVRAHAAITARERNRFTLARIIADGDATEAKKYLDASKPR